MANFGNDWDGPLVSTTMVLKGHLIQNGVRFLWWVIDGSPSTVTVSHPVLGTRSRPVNGDPKKHARQLAEEILSEV